MWRLFPQFLGFRTSFGEFCSCLWNFSASTSIPWLRLWSGLFWLRLPILRFSLSCGSWPCGFWLRAPISGGPCVCVCVGFFLRQRSCVFFLSSCSAWGRLLLSLFWCGFCASSWGACGFPQRVLPQVPLGGSTTFLAPVACLAPAVEPCCWVGGVFGAPLGFLPCAVLFLRGLRFVQLTLPQVALGGFLTFLSPGA